ncbi:sodium:proton antiporter [Skermania sp. ID1734]|uniref:MnhB domain-containing protein n=1 Tax=Skermania sp. ID1734 TaxID=2597516 RepID=UPI00117F6D2D|nr:MnhB domain-containing protein [Skermania sp. ID1734]TSD95391.1 sodium:proton antiporter [Skermania sp. ID1734]
MTRRTRLLVFLAGAVGFAIVYAVAVFGMPSFGGLVHPYRDAAVAAAVGHQTANVVSSVNFDQRALDTLGEETILLGSVVGAVALLRSGSQRVPPPENVVAQPLQATKLVGYVLLPVTLMIGLDLVVHGHLTPGGGFQGGVVLGTGLHLLYVGGDYPALERLRPMPALHIGEALGALSFALVGVAGLIVSGAFLVNVVPQGTFGQLFSAGTVPVLNVAVGFEVACGAMVLLATFLDQWITGSAGEGASD